jgi:hypothetical protein
MNYLIHVTSVHPFLCLQYSILLVTIATITTLILLLLLLFHYYHHYKTIATDKPLRASLFPGAAELTTHLLRLINILWLPLCQINKFGFYFPRRLLRSPILVGHQQVCGPELPLPKLLPDTVVSRGRARLPSYAAARITDTDRLEPAGAEIMGGGRAFTSLRRCQSRPVCTLDQEPHGCGNTIDQ